MAAAFASAAQRPANLVRVVKLGGSLLNLPDWAARFRRWLAEQPPAVNILIVGGGRLADAIRDRDREVGLDPSTAHWLAIDAMSSNMAAVRRQLPEALPVDRCEDLQAAFAERRLVAFGPRDFLRRIEPQAGGSRLPHSWDATSDSIAARLADVLGAGELVLLKSAPPPPQAATLQQIADAGYVDRGFPVFASGIALVRFDDLGCEKCHERPTS